MAEGRITRGTTGTNRLRRVDRFLAASPAFVCSSSPLVVDLGFGANPWTAVELFDRLRRVRADVHVLGLEIDPARVLLALEAARPGLSFAVGGFEVPTPDGAPAHVIRAMNVLRQYDEEEVAPAWRRMIARLRPGGLLVEGTSNEVGRVASWVSLDPSGPTSFTLSLRLTDLERPSIVAERLPKILIHRNVLGEPVHELLRDVDRAWQYSASLGSYGPRQRWLSAIRVLRSSWPVLGTASRWRLGELTVPWGSVAPNGFRWRD